MNTEVKICAIGALGDICLASEHEFLAYFDQTMEILIQAGQMSLQTIDTSLPVEDQRNFHQLRESIVESFMTIINGIKTPHQNSSYREPASVQANILNMFYYLETLMLKEDLQVGNPEFGANILELYCDILQLQNDMQSREIIRNSRLHLAIERKLSFHRTTSPEFSQTIARFQDTVALLK